MNPNNYPDPTAYKKVLVDNLWAALEATLTEDNLNKVRCLEPTCNSFSSSYDAKLMGLTALTSILYIRVTLGEEDISDVLDALEVCACG